MPVLREEGEGAFDSALFSAYEKLAGLDPLNEEQATQCQLPLNLGGRGLRSQERLAPAAWASSWADCLPEVLRRSGVAELSDLETSTLPLAAACRDAAATLPPEDTDLLHWRDLAQQRRPKLQKALSRRIDKKLHSGLLSALDTSGRARLRSCGGPLAAGWQWASPASPAERLTDADYRATARALLGQPATAAAGATCQNVARTGTGAGRRCGEAVCGHAHHAHRCAVGGGLVARSNDLEAVWASIHRECGHTVERQVSVAGWDRWRWSCGACSSSGFAWALPAGPCSCGARLEATREEAVLDLQVRSAEAPCTYFDVTVRHGSPGNAQRLLTAASRDGAVCREAEADKRRRYPDGQTPWRVVPLTVEIFGRYGRSSSVHLRKLARTAAVQLGFDGDAEAAASALVARWGARLSAALHRANAARLRSCLGSAVLDETQLEDLRP